MTTARLADRPARPSRRGWALLLAGVLVLSACGTDGAGPGEVTCEDGRVVSAPQGPGALAATTLTVLGDDTPVPTACWTGRPLLVNFWAEWCGPCRDEMPALEAVHRDLGDRVRFIGVNFEDRTHVALAFAAEMGVTYELVEDPNGSYFRATGGRGAPYTLLVDDTGIVRLRHAGPVTERQLRGLLAEHLGVG